MTFAAEWPPPKGDRPPKTGVGSGTKARPDRTVESWSRLRRKTRTDQDDNTLSDPSRSLDSTLSLDPKIKGQYHRFPKGLPDDTGSGFDPKVPLPSEGGRRGLGHVYPSLDPSVPSVGHRDPGVVDYHCRGRRQKILHDTGPSVCKEKSTECRRDTHRRYHKGHNAPTRC